MGNDDITRELRQIEHELIELELSASLHAVPTAAEHARAFNFLNPGDQPSAVDDPSLPCVAS
jgi:hypothetical protein